MLKIKIDYIDELHDITEKLCIVTYLRGLYNEDRNLNCFFDKFDFLCNPCNSFLYDLQEDLVFKLKALIKKEDFTVSDK